MYTGVMEIKNCKRCGKSWCYRGSGRPLRCGKCKSPYWDKEKAGSEIDLSVNKNSVNNRDGARER